jgi:membrane associated rhomboid family serine protease
MSQPPQPAFNPPPMAQGCYRHPDRATLIGCQRCRRPICPECMVPASVGVQCPECVREGARATRQGEGPYGGQRSANPRSTTFVLMGVNLAVYLLVLLSGGGYGTWAVRLSISPLGSCLVDDGSGRYYPGVGARVCSAVDGAFWADGVATGAWWQVLTSAFTHAELVHLGANMLALFFLGPPLEQVLGRARFLAVYLVSALAASTAVMWLAAPDSSALGASGAIFGMLGALLVIARKSGGNYQTILMWLGINVVITVVGGAGISWQGHLGGLIGGLAAAAVLVLPPRVQRDRWQWPGVVVLTVLLAAAIAVRAMMLQ